MESPRYIYTCVCMAGGGIRFALGEDLGALHIKPLPSAAPEFQPAMGQSASLSLRP